MMNKTIFTYILILCSITAFFFTAAAEKKDYCRIVVLGDPHLPFKLKEAKEKSIQEKTIKAKENVIKDINSWKDADRVVVVGDLVSRSGNKFEYNYVRNFFKKLKVPFLPINGNHDYLYEDEKEGDKKLIQSSPQVRKEKLERFKDYFKLKNNYYTERAMNYLLVFLSANDLETKYQTEISEEEIKWFKKTLDENKNIPTIIFFHSPLAGTLLNKDDKPAKGNTVA